MSKIINRLFSSPQEKMLNQMKKLSVSVCNDVLAEYRKREPADSKEMLVLLYFCLNIDPAKVKTKELESLFIERSTCIEGICYALGIECSFLKDAMVMRCLQFTKMVDQYLYEKGIKPCSHETKILLYKSLGLYDGYIDQTDYWDKQ